MADNRIFLRKVGIKAGMSLMFQEGTIFFVEAGNPVDRKQVRFDGGDDKIWVGKEFNSLQALAEILATSHNLWYEIIVPNKHIRFIKA